MAARIFSIDLIHPQQLLSALEWACVKKKKEKKKLAICFATTRFNFTILFLMLQWLLPLSWSPILSDHLTCSLFTSCHFLSHGSLLLVYPTSTSILRKFYIFYFPFLMILMHAIYLMFTFAFVHRLNTFISTVVL